MRHILATFLLFFGFALSAQADKDLSSETSIIIEEPRLAHVNITGIDALPTTKTADSCAWLEYADDNGICFRKHIIINAQGATSLLFPKKNYAIDFCEDEWLGDSTTSIRIGNWVKQDAFHLKASWIDTFRGGLAVATAYKLYDDMAASKPHILKRAGISGYSPKALCHPDGFPCILSLNGQFVGIYAWQLKKHRRNMGMKKNNPQHVWFQLQAYTTLLSSGEVNWEHIEVRNPKHITDETKDCISRLGNYTRELKEMEKRVSDDVMRNEIEQRFDVTSVIDFIIHGLITSNIDGFGKNANFFTYNGTTWFVTPYDLDETFGNTWINTFQFPADWSFPAQNHEMSFNITPYNWVIKYFRTELEERYAELRTSGTISTTSIMEHLVDWNNRVGADAYEQENAQWPTALSCKNSVTDGHWEWLQDWSNYYNESHYDPHVYYAKGSTCIYDYRIFRAKEAVKGVAPVAASGYTDTEERVRAWLDRRIALEDLYLNYEATANSVVAPAATGSATLYDLTGRPLPAAVRKGLYIKNGKKYVKTGSSRNISA